MKSWGFLCSSVPYPSRGGMIPLEVYTKLWGRLIRVNVKILGWERERMVLNPLFGSCDRWMWGQLDWSSTSHCMIHQTVSKIVYMFEVSNLGFRWGWGGWIVRVSDVARSERDSSLCERDLSVFLHPLLSSDGLNCHWNEVIFSCSLSFTHILLFF